MNEEDSRQAKIQISSTSFGDDYGSISIELRNIKTSDVLMFLLALSEWLENVESELNGELPEPEQTPEENAGVPDPANQQEPEEQEPPRQKRKYTKRQPAAVRAEPEQKVVIDEKQTVIPAVVAVDLAKIVNTVIKVEKEPDPPFDLAPAKQPTTEDLAIAAKVEEEFAATDKVMENFEMHLANIRSDFAIADAASIWLKVEPDFKKIDASDTVIGVAQDNLVRTVEGLLKIPYENARSLVGAAVKKERERRAAAPIDVIAEPVADDAEAKFCADLSKQTSLAAAVKSVIQHGFPGAKTVKISDALAVVAKYRSVSPVIAQSNDNTLRTVIPTLARQLGMVPAA